MNDITPTRSAVIALKDERRAMQEGHAFLDEKCLLLAAAMLHELRRFDQASRLAELEKSSRGTAARIVEQRRSLLGVALKEANVERLGDRAAVAVAPSPEAEACRSAFAALASHFVAMAAMSGNLERLYREYRRSVRRVRALEDVLLPELDRTVYDIETRLEELEQDEALWLRQRRFE